MANLQIGALAILLAIGYRAESLLEKAMAWLIVGFSLVICLGEFLHG